MINMRGGLRRALVCVWAGALVGFLCGCEDDGGGSSHDFGDNNPDLYVAMGDSITGDYNGGVEPYPPRLAGLLGKRVVNEGSGGATSGDGAGRVNGVLSGHKPGYLLILYGANDVIRSYGTQGIVDNLRSMIQAAKNNKTVPAIATLTPMTGSHSLWNGSVQNLNTWIRMLASQEDAELVDLEKEFGDGSGFMQSDGLHPNDSGCQLIALAFYDKVK